MVSAMGNHNQTHPGVPNYPAGYGIGIAVGATDNNDNIANFSVHGNYIDVSAPGVHILSTLNNSYGYMDGTSMAAPFVSGIASLLKGYNSNLDNDDIENIIKLSADKVQGMNGNNYTTTYGYGRVNAEQALKYLQSPYSLYQWTTNGGSITSSTGQYKQVFIGASGLSSGVYFVKRYEVRKNVNFPQSFYSLIGVWGRGVSTTGWDKSSPNLGMKFCEVVPGTVSTTGVTLRTYVYQVWSISGAYLGYYPTSPSNVHFAYTALGTKAPTITGTNTVCTSNSTFTLENRPPNSSVSWTKSSNLTQVGGNSGTTYTVKAKNSYVSGNGWVKAIVNGVEFKKTFWVGKPKFTVEGDEQLEIRMPGIAMIDYSNGGGNSTNVFWSRSGAIASVNGGPIKARFRAGSRPGMGAVYATVTNTCGSKENRLLVEVTGGWYSIYPNPASDVIYISIDKNKLPNDVNIDNIHIKLYDKMKVLKKQSVLKGYHTSINIREMKNGIYIIQLITDKKTYEEKIIISK